MTDKLHPNTRPVSEQRVSDVEIESYIEKVESPVRHPHFLQMTAVGFLYDLRDARKELAAANERESMLDLITTEFTALQEQYTALREAVQHIVEKRDWTHEIDMDPYFELEEIYKAQDAANEGEAQAPGGPCPNCGRYYSTATIPCKNCGHLNVAPASLADMKVVVDDDMPPDEVGLLGMKDGKPTGVVMKNVGAASTCPSCHYRLIPCPACGWEPPIKLMPAPASTCPECGEPDCHPAESSACKRGAAQKKDGEE